jgi:hypothetical protein
LDLRARRKYTLGLIGLQIPGSAVYVFATLVVATIGSSPKRDWVELPSNRTYSNPKTVIPLFVPIYSFPFTIISWAKCGIDGKVSRPFVCDVTYNCTRVVAL